jgi:hypothetical protein
MKELIRSLPLILFLFLLLVLSISIYFGNMNIHESLDTINNPKLNDELANDIKTIIDYVKAPPTTAPSATVAGTGTATANVPPSGDDWFNQWDQYANSNFIHIPKTQIVPLNCPNCQNKNTNANANGSGSACTSCGGLGGNGTTSHYKNRFSDFLSTYGAGYRGNGKWAGFAGGCSSKGGSGDDGNDPSLSELAEKAGAGAVGLLRDTGSGATGLLRDTGSGAVGLLKDTGSGAAGFVKDVGSGAAGFVKDVGSGAVDFAEDVGSGAANLLRSNPVQVRDISSGGGGSNVVGGSSSVGRSGSYQQGNQSSGVVQSGMIDPYSYNGALVQKGSNFIPITNDFSAFRK